MYRIGNLGDMLVSVPAFWVLREHFRDAELTLLSQGPMGKAKVVGEAVLQGSGIFDAFITYPGMERGMSPVRRMYRAAALAARLRAARFDELVYQAPTYRSTRQRQRDMTFFRMCGIQRTRGFGTPQVPHPATVSRPLPTIAREAELLLEGLSRDGIPVPAVTDLRLDLNLHDVDERIFNVWKGSLEDDYGRPWIGFGPGSKMDCKRWPLTRFEELGRQLIDQLGCWPVIFGGPEDRCVGEDLIAAWGVGYNAAGALGIRASAAALSRCRFYVGNDTGTMHLAASTGTRCIALFSARDYPGKWAPLGHGHVVLRETVPCEGCMLEICTERQNECMNSITTDIVLDACLDLWTAGHD